MPNGKKIFLTFDDGPSVTYTEQILNVLANYNAKATFFVCGKNVERYPALAKKIVEAGHSIGNHAYAHTRWRSYSGILKSEIDHTQIIIKQTTGVLPTLFRPPYGVLAPWLKPWLKAQGYQTFIWDIKVYDWLKLPPEFMSARIIEQAFPGCIVLLHDGESIRENCNRENTVKALDQLLAKLKPLGWEFEKL